MVLVSVSLLNHTLRARARTIEVGHTSNADAVMLAKAFCQEKIFCSGKREKNLL